MSGVLWRAACIVAAAAAVIALAGCAGTVQREGGGDVRKLAGEKYSRVDVVLSEVVRRSAPEHPLFNANDIAARLQRMLEANGLIRQDGNLTVVVTINDFRIRSNAAAVWLGAMAGADTLAGQVRIADRRQSTVHSFKVDASYGLGGFAGGQDGVRLNWLYDKFAELTVAELAGTTDGKTLAKGSPAPGSRDAAAMQRVAVIQPAAPSRPPAVASGYAAVDDIDAIPYLSDRGRAAYREWLTRPSPRAFAVSPGGHWWPAWGPSSSDPALPAETSARALAGCGRSAGVPCALYAVDDAVVWSRAPLRKP
jgi:hypothetical protein